MGVHWQTIRNYIDRGDLKAYKVGKLVKIEEQDLEQFIKGESKTEEKLEIELRYKLKDRQKLEKRLAEFGAKVVYQAHVIDHWFIPINIRNNEQQIEWFDKKRGCAVRVREQDNGYTGKITVSMETKRMNAAMNHNSLLEAEVTIDSFENGRKLLEMMDRKEFITINKNRVVYKYQNFKICIDDIKGYGVGAELEIGEVKNREKALVEIKHLASKLGLHERDRLEKSMTTEAMLTMAKF